MTSPYMIKFSDITSVPLGRTGYEVEAITSDEFDRTLVVKAEFEAGSKGDRWTPGEGPDLAITEVRYRRERDKKEFVIPSKAWPKAFGADVYFAEASLLDAFAEYDTDY